MFTSFQITFTALIFLAFLGGPGRAHGAEVVPCEAPYSSYYNSVTSQSEDILKMLRPPAHDDVYKSSAELDAYFFRYRHRCQGDSHRQFMQEYKKYLRVAAEAFDIPYEILACKIFRESQFFKTAKSRVGASGLGQFMPVAMKDISRVISDSDLKEKDLEQLKKLEALKESDATLTRGQRADLSYLRTKKKNQDHRQRWENYFQRLRQTAPTKNKRSISGVYKTPRRFGPEGAKTPVVAIGATAFYARYLIDNVLGELPKDITERKERLIIMAGAYNMGPGNALDLIKKHAKDDSPQEIIAALSRNVESRRHMESVRRCIEKRNLAGPVAGEEGGLMISDKVCPGEMPEGAVLEILGPVQMTSPEKGDQ